MIFEDRAEAGRKLAAAVAEARPRDPVVLALPRGGVPLGATVAERLDAPLDLILVSKLGLPANPEVAAGALVGGSAPLIFWNHDVLRHAGLTEADFSEQIAEKQRETDRRRRAYLSGRAEVGLTGRTAILVDDGVATGATLRVAIRAAREKGADAIWVAVPVAPREMIPVLEAEADRVICLDVPRAFSAVGAHYRQFGQVGDAEVQRLMAAARAG